jgi:hypothetical protein
VEEVTQVHIDDADHSVNPDQFAFDCSQLFGLFWFFNLFLLGNLSCFNIKVVHPLKTE